MCQDARKQQTPQFARNGTVACSLQRSQEDKLLCCITADQYRGNLFVDGFAQWFGSTLFLLIHLPDQKIHGGFGNDINLLTNGCDWKDGFAGNRGIVKSNNLIS